jgi:hypothetical protein
MFSDGRLLSNEFMQLPSKKLWPFYYVEIKNPKCFDDIYVGTVSPLPAPVPYRMIGRLKSKGVQFEC